MSEYKPTSAPCPGFRGSSLPAGPRSHSGTVCPLQTEQPLGRTASAAWESSQLSFFKSIIKEKPEAEAGKKGYVRTGETPQPGGPSPYMPLLWTEEEIWLKHGRSSRELAPLDPLVATLMAAKAPQSLHHPVPWMLYPRPHKPLMASGQSLEA